jgi:hypothetical protein
VVEQHVGERRDDRNRRAAETQSHLSVVELDIGHRETGDLDEWLGVEQDQQRDHTVLQRDGVVVVDAADQREPLSLADRLHRGALDRREPEPASEVLADSPGQERAQQVLFDPASGGIPAIDVNLSTIGEAAAVGGEVGEERGGLPQLAAGVDVAVGPDRSVLRDVTQVAQEVPGGLLPQRLTVLGILDAGQPAGKPLLEQVIRRAGHAVASSHLTRSATLPLPMPAV